MSHPRLYDLNAVAEVMTRISNMPWSHKELEALKLHLVPLVDIMDRLRESFLLRHLEKLERYLLFHFDANPTTEERSKCVVDCLVDFRCETHRLLTGAQEYRA